MDAGESGPSERHRELFNEFRARHLMRAEVETPLFEAYREIREMERVEYEKVPPLRSLFGTDFPELLVPADIWSIATLSRIELCKPGAVDFGLLYSMNWGDPEHILSANVKDWRILDVGKEG